MNANDLVKEWMRFAKSDLITAHHMFEDVYPKEIEISCYHSGQAAEKAMKAYLTFKGIVPPKTHDLITLCGLCKGYDDTFSNILEICSNLAPYTVVVRYPNELNVDEVITKNAIRMAEEIYSFCMSRIG